MKSYHKAGTALLVVAAFILMAFSSIAVAAENKPKIIIEEMVHNFGTVFEQEAYKHSFSVKNVGEADLIIKNVKPG